MVKKPPSYQWYWMDWWWYIEELGYVNMDDEIISMVFDVLTLLIDGIWCINTFDIDGIWCFDIS